MSFATHFGQGRLGAKPARPYRDWERRGLGQVILGLRHRLSPRPGQAEAQTVNTLLNFYSETRPGRSVHIGIEELTSQARLSLHYQVAGMASARSYYRADQLEKLLADASGLVEMIAPDEKWPVTSDDLAGEVERRLRS